MQKEDWHVCEVRKCQEVVSESPFCFCFFKILVLFIALQRFICSTSFLFGCEVLKSDLSHIKLTCLVYFHDLLLSCPQLTGFPLYITLILCKVFNTPDLKPVI